MKIRRIVEQENKQSEVTIELNEEQLRFCTEVGMGVLLAAGAAQLMTPPERPDTAELIITDTSPITH